MRILPTLLAAAALLGAPAVRAQVSEGIPGPVRAAFPDADRVDADDVILTGEMASRLDALARSRIQERMITFYTARRGAQVLGYAALQSHVVRTKRETLLVVFEPDGRLRKLTVVSFLEPPEYKPSDRWLSTLEGKGSGDRLAVGDDVAPITGATLSARGVTEQSRWLLQALKMAREQGRMR